MIFFVFFRWINLVLWYEFWCGWVLKLRGIRFNEKYGLPVCGP